MKLRSLRSACLRRWSPAALALIFACSDHNSPTKTTETLAKIPFDASVDGLPDAVPTTDLQVKDGDTVRLNVEYVAKWISGRKVRMLAYNRSVPGPTLKIPQGSQIAIVVKNETNLPTSLHSHGVRMDAQYDGVPGESQPEIDSGQSFVYKIRFPDAGIFWYHPHSREDYGLELGLYGSYLVAPTDTAYWAPVNRESVLMLSDVAMQNGVLAPFYENLPTHSMMGLFGNVFLMNGDTAFTMHVKRNETIRFNVVNASGARVYNLQFSRDMDMNIVGADNGRFEFPSSRESYLIAPSERFIFQLYFNDALNDYDTLDLWNVTPQGIAVLGHFVYDPDTIKTDYRSSLSLQENPQAAASIDPFRPYFDKLPDEEILLTGYMDMSQPLAKAASIQHDPDPTNKLGVEWSDSVHGPAMQLMNEESDPQNMKWIIRDLKTGKENHDIQWVFQRGSKVLIRVHNDSSTAQTGNIMEHAMPHPLHFHGQRFLVVRENGVTPVEGLAWRDSYLIGRGFTVDLLLDASNPGDWMFHCHIAEHVEDDMMGHFRVVDSLAGPAPFDWFLSLHAPKLDSLRRDSVLVQPVPDTLIGNVNPLPGAPAPASATDGFLYIDNADVPSLRVSSRLSADGSFAVPSASVLGDVPLAHLKLYLKPASLAYKPVPDTLRLTFDRRARLVWSLDLDLAGDASLHALRHDTSVVSSMQGEVQGKVNGYDPTLVRDTVYFKNMIYPDLFSNAPLAADGSFSFDAGDIVGALDGLHTLHVMLKPKSAPVPMDPDSLSINVSIP